MSYVFSQSSRLVRTVILILCMLASILGTAAVAAIQPTTILATTSTTEQLDELAVQSHLNNDCDLFSSSWKYIGNSANEGGFARGVRGEIDPLEASYHLCSEGVNSQGGYTHEELYTYVGLEDTTDSGNYAKVGIIKCNFTVDTLSWCTSNGADAYFVYKRAGCGQSEAVEKLGDADFTSHEYQIYVYNGTIFVKIDGVVEYSASVGTSGTRLSCWLNANNDVRIRALGGFLDGGDQLALSADKLNFDNVQYINFGDVLWEDPSFSSPCDDIDSSSELAGNCTVNNGQDFDIWQTPN